MQMEQLDMQLSMIYHLGRNVDEMIRMVDTMLFTNEYGEVCPAGWAKR